MYSKLASSLLKQGYRLIVCHVLLPAHIPTYFSVSAAVLAVLICGVVLQEELEGESSDNRPLYVIPFVLYLSTEDPCSLDQRNRQRHIMFQRGACAFVIFTLKLTRRRKGFKTTPMDFLILSSHWLALRDGYVPAGYQISFCGSQGNHSFFQLRGLMGELRGKLNWLTGRTLHPWL